MMAPGPIIQRENEIQVVSNMQLRQLLKFMPNNTPAPLGAAENSPVRRALGRVASVPLKCRVAGERPE
jgi:hypothetical protein